MAKKRQSFALGATQELVRLSQYAKCNHLKTNKTNSCMLAHVMKTLA